MRWDVILALALTLTLILVCGGGRRRRMRVGGVRVRERRVRGGVHDLAGARRRRRGYPVALLHSRLRGCVGGVVRGVRWRLRGEAALRLRGCVRSASRVCGLRRGGRRGHRHGALGALLVLACSIAHRRLDRQSHPLSLRPSSASPRPPLTRRRPNNLLAVLIPQHHHRRDALQTLVLADLLLAPAVPVPEAVRARGAARRGERLLEGLDAVDPGRGARLLLLPLGDGGRRVRVLGHPVPCGRRMGFL